MNDIDMQVVLVQIAIDPALAQEIRDDPELLTTRYGLNAEQAAKVAGAQIDASVGGPRRLEERLSRAGGVFGSAVAAAVDTYAQHVDAEAQVNQKPELATEQELAEREMAQPDPTMQAVVDAARSGLGSGPEVHEADPEPEPQPGAAPEHEMAELESATEAQQQMQDLRDAAARVAESQLATNELAGAIADVLASQHDAPFDEAKMAQLAAPDPAAQMAPLVNPPPTAGAWAGVQVGAPEAEPSDPRPLHDAIVGKAPEHLATGGMSTLVEWWQGLFKPLPADDTAEYGGGPAEPGPIVK